MSIYIIKSKEQSLHDFYIGSTEDMRNRKHKHKYDCYSKNGPKYNYKLYKFIRANGGWENFEMIQIASVWDKATKTLFQIEQDYIDQYKPNLNTLRAYRSEECDKQHRENNKEYYKEWRDKNKEYHKEYKKEHYEKNKDRILEKCKEYYHKNKDRISEKFTCECGGKYTRSHKSRHFKTKLHKSFIENE